MSIASDGVSSEQFQTLRRGSLVEQIIESFKREIVSGQLRPGDKVPSESELAARFGVSRGAVREAMKTLQAIGVVTIERGSGTHIVERPTEALLNPLVFAVLLESTTPTELVELREMLEVGYCLLAAQRITDEDWAALETAQLRFEEYVTQPDADGANLASLDLEFHYRLLDATHNPMVRKIGRAVEELYHNTIQATNRTDRGRGTGIAGHRSIMQAIRDGDPETIRLTVRSSLVFWATEIEREGSHPARSVAEIRP